MRRIIAIATVITMAAPLQLLAAGPATTTGSIIGTATSVSGQPLSNYVVRDRNMANGQVADLTKSDASGRFTFATLAPGSYAIEVVDPSGRVVGTSSLIAVKAGSTAVATVTGAVAPAAATTAKRGLSTAAIVTIIAVTAGVTGLAIAATNNNSSPSR
jgi:hypothetical protein